MSQGAEISDATIHALNTALYLGQQNAIEVRDVALNIMPTVRKAAWQMFAEGWAHNGHRQEGRFQACPRSHRAAREPAPAPADR